MSGDESTSIGIEDSLIKEAYVDLYSSHQGQFILNLENFGSPQILNFYYKPNLLHINQVKAKMQSLRKKYRQIFDIGYSYFEKYLLQHLRYNTVYFNTRFRHQPKYQYLRTAVGLSILSYIVFNFSEVQNQDKLVFKQSFKTEYTKLVEEVRADKNDNQTYKAVYDLIQKGKETGLSSIQLLALSEIIKKPELNLQAEYIASLK